MGQVQGLHPISRAALGFHIWRVVGLSAGHALGGAGGLCAVGTAQDRLQRWIAGADHATRASLRVLEDACALERRATEVCAGLSGRTPPQLIEMLCDWPLVSAPMAETQTGASRAAIQRNLNWMTERGIVREVTGQGRYRFWSAG